MSGPGHLILHRSFRVSLEPIEVDTGINLGEVLEKSIRESTWVRFLRESTWVRFLPEGGALVVDNPGMREFGILGAERGIGSSFSDITSLASSCRYRDCTHASEQSCAVLEALKSDEIGQDHYENYMKLREESEFYQMSYAEKKKKDHDFGRYIKTAKKDLRDD